MKIFRIKYVEDGEETFSNNGFFSSKGKIWTSLGGLHAHLWQSSKSYTGSFYGKSDLSLDDMYVEEIDLEKMTKKSLYSVRYFLNLKTNLNNIEKNYGGSVSAVYKTLEEKDQLRNFHYIVILRRYPDDCLTEISKAIKTIGLKKSDYYQSSDRNYTSLALRTENDLLMFKLALGSDMKYLKISNMDIKSIDKSSKTL